MHSRGRARPPNKGMKLTNLSEAPGETEAPLRAFRRFAAVRTGSQLIPGVGQTLGGDMNREKRPFSQTAVGVVVLGLVVTIMGGLVVYRLTRPEGPAVHSSTEPVRATQPPTPGTPLPPTTEPAPLRQALPMLPREDEDKIFGDGDDVYMIQVRKRYIPTAGTSHLVAETCCYKQADPGVSYHPVDGTFSFGMPVALAVCVDSAWVAGRSTVVQLDVGVESADKPHAFNGFPVGTQTA